MSSDVTHITSSHGAWRPNFLTSRVNQSRIIEERLHELERRKIVSYGCFYFSHINGGWHRFYDLVDCLSYISYLCIDIKCDTDHMLMWTQKTQWQMKTWGHSTLTISYNSHSVSRALFCPPPKLSTLLMKDFQAVGSPVVAPIVTAKI